MVLKNKKTSLYVLLIILLSMLLVLVISGCTGGGPKVEDSPDNGSEKEEIGGEEGVLQGEENKSAIVIDHAGREVKLPGNPERILALTPLTVEGLFVFGIQPIATVDNYNIREEADSLPSVGARGDINIERVHEVAPNLIIAQRRHHGELINAFEETGASVYIYDPSKLGDNPLIDSVVFLGELLDLEDKASSYVEQVNETADDLNQQIKSETDIKTVLMIRDGDTVRAAQRVSGYGTVIEVLGLENVLPEEMPGETRESFIPFDIETIIEKDPDIILIRVDSKNPEDNKDVLERYRNDPLWQGLTAVKNDRIKTLPFKVHPGRSSSEDMIRLTAEVILSTAKQ